MKVKLLRGANIDGQSLLARTNGGTNIMVDAGMDMKGGKPIPLDDVEKIDYLFITHAHLDHSGSVPEIKENYHPQIICNEDTEKIMNILFQDKIYLKNYSTSLEPPVIKSDGYIGVNGRYDLQKFVLHSFGAHHIVGASSFIFEADGKTVMISGDISKHIPPSVADEMKFPSIKPDILFLESTYGGAIFPNREKEEERLVEKVDEVLINGGNVLIPAFSVGRTQDVALTLKKHGITAYIDGMGRKVADAFGLTDIKRVIDNHHREKILFSRGGKAVIAAAGFLGGGFVLKYIKNWAPQKKNALIFPSPYQSGLAKEIVGGAKSVRIVEKYYNKGQQTKKEGFVPIKAEVNKFSLSAHADQNGLVEYAKTVSPKKIVLIHGEAESKTTLAERLRAELKVEVVIAKDGDEYEI